MPIKRTITIPLEISIHEDSIFLMVGGGKYTVPGTEEEQIFGIAGGRLIAYLPGGGAVSIHVEQIIQAGLEAIKEDVGATVNNVAR